MSATAERQPDWAAFRSTIENLYWQEEKELPEVMKTMAEVYGFSATMKMYKKRFKEWGLVKNLKADESMAMLQIANRRLRENKDTEFIRRGKVVKHNNLRRFAKRHGLSVEEGAGFSSDTEVSTPPYITYRTPEPEQPSHPSCTALPHYDFETSDGEQVTLGGSPESHSLESQGSPFCNATIHWLPPSEFSYTLDNTYMGHQEPVHTSIQEASFPCFSHESPSLEASKDFPHTTSAPDFPRPGWWPIPHPPSNGYHDSDEAAHSWAYVYQPQETAHPLNHGVSADDLPVFSSTHPPDIPHLMPKSCHQHGRTDQLRPDYYPTPETTFHDEGGQQVVGDQRHRCAAAVIAEEMVRLFCEMGVLDDLLRLAEQRQKANVAMFLYDAIRKLEMQGSRGSSVS